MLRSLSSILSIRRMLNYAVWVIFLVLIFFAPLALGSNRATPVYIVQMLVLAGCFVCILRCVFYEHSIPWVKTRVNFWIVLFFGIGVLQILLPGGMPPLIGKTAYAHATVESLAKLASYVLLFWLVLLFVRTEKQISRLVRAMLILAFGASLAGIIQKLSGADKVLWFYEIVYSGETFRGFFSTFINANHFASFIGMIVFIILGRWLYLNVKRSSHTRGKYPAERIFFLFVMTLSSTALFMSLSRGGILIFTLSLAIFYGFILWERKHRNSGMFLVLFLVSTVLMLFWIGLQPILDELGTILRPSGDISMDLRILAWKQSYSDLILTHPFLGTGLGTFQYVFEGVKTKGLSGYWLHGHSDWVEVFTETGFAGGIVFLILALTFFDEIRPVRWNRWDPYIKYNGAAALGAVMYMLLMSSYDFPLRTTACAVYFSMIAGFAVKLRQFHDEMEGKNRVRSILLNKPWKRAGAVVLVSAVFLISVTRITMPYIASRLVRQGGLSSISNLELAIRLDPLNADYHYYMGQTLAQAAFYRKGKFNEPKMDLALREIDKAMKLNPSSGAYHYGLARLYQRMREPEKARREYREAVKKSPENPFFQIGYAVFCFNRAMKERVIFEKKITATEDFKEGLKAYYRAREIDPAVNLTQYRDYVAGFRYLQKVFEKEGLLTPGRKF